VFGIFSGLDLLRGVSLAAIYSGTSLCSQVPVVRPRQIAWPKRPASALGGPDRVNHTPFALLRFLQKYAVARAGIFNDSHPQSFAFEKPVLYILNRHLQVARDEPDFGPAHPDISPLRPGAATAALEALKMQTGSIPKIFIITVIHNVYFTTKHN
jgi:hypothetical protein